MSGKLDDDCSCRLPFATRHFMRTSARQIATAVSLEHRHVTLANLGSYGPRATVTAAADLEIEA